MDGQKTHPAEMQQRLLRRHVVIIVAVAAHAVQRQVRALLRDGVGVRRVVAEVDDRVRALFSNRKEHMLRLPVRIGQHKQLHSVTLFKVFA